MAEHLATLLQSVRPEEIIVGPDKPEDAATGGEVVPGSSSDDSQKRPRGFRDFLWVAFPKTFSGGLQLVTNLLLVRQLGPDQSGMLFVCITAILLSDAVLGSALDVAVVKLSTGGQAHNPLQPLRVQQAALIAKTVGCALLALPVILWARPLGNALFHRQNDPALLALSAAALFGLLTLRSVQTWFQVSGRFAWYGATDLLHSAVKFGGIGLLLGFGMATPRVVLSIYAAGPLLVAAALLATVTREMLLVPPSLEALRQLGSVAKWYLGAAAAGSITARMDILLVSALAGTAQAGLFSAAQVFVLPFQLLGMYLGVVFAPRILPLWERGELTGVYFRFQRLAGAASILIYAVACLAAGRLTEVLLPHAYLGARALVLLLLPSALVSLINFPWTVSFLMFTRARALLALELAAIPMLLLIYRLSIVPLGAAGAAAVTSGFAVLKMVVYQILAARTLRRGAGYPIVPGMPTAEPGAPQ